MEIERKWMVKGWPEGLPLREEFAMRQGYISVRPTVRIREEALTGGRTDYILCFKSGGGLAREEIERSIDKELFDDLEYKIIKAFVDRRKPIWGICRGIQILNVYFGGTLTQDIPTQLGGDHSKGVCHQVTLKKDSILGNLYGESMEVNSYHHQALDKLGEGLEAIAWGESNGHTFTEAVQHETLPIWSVQWHPERMTGPVTNPKECADSLPMFEYFVKQCAK